MKVRIRDRSSAGDDISAKELMNKVRVMSSGFNVNVPSAEVRTCNIACTRRSAESKVQTRKSAGNSNGKECIVIIERPFQLHRKSAFAVGLREETQTCAAGARAECNSVACVALAC
jgi:hypothetical protein